MSGAARGNPMLRGTQNERNPKSHAAEMRGENEESHDRDDRSRDMADADDTRGKELGPKAHIHTGAHGCYSASKLAPPNQPHGELNVDHGKVGDNKNYQHAQNCEHHTQGYWIRPGDKGPDAGKDHIHD